ncbi:MAG: formate dehydrogenase accessory protein FdhE [Deltaproteobacteria bacterium]|nr:formate dehydrogenase accessory protein FdhE [Deltaproteobacteria bacterium]
MGEMLSKSLETIEKYKNISPHYEELLEILEEILILREEYRRKLKENVFLVDETHIDKKMSGGLPLIDFTRNNLDLSQPRQYFFKLLEIAKKRSPDETEKILKDLDEGSLDYDNMVRDSFVRESEQQTPEEEERIFDLLGLFVEESLRPALEMVAEKYHDAIEKSEWTEGYCPVCSKEPKIAELREEEGFRYLYCNQCGFEWNYLRIKCPFCGNEDQQELAYFTIEGEEKYRVDVCNNCKRYIKTVDFRKTTEKANLDVEDIATLHLDILASEEGYE